MKICLIVYMLARTRAVYIYFIQVQYLLHLYTRSSIYSILWYTERGLEKNKKDYGLVRHSLTGFIIHVYCYITNCHQSVGGASRRGWREGGLSVCVCVWGELFVWDSGKKEPAAGAGGKGLYVWEGGVRDLAVAGGRLWEGRLRLHVIIIILCIIG